MHLRPFLLIAAVMLLTAGCARDEAALAGSLGDFYDLRHDTVRARLYASELAIEYVRETNEVPVRVTILREAGIEVGEIDIAEQGDVTGRSDGVDIPRLRTGTLRLTQYEGLTDTRIVGDFDATFDTGADVAALSGRFDTTLTVIERVSGYDVDADFPDVRQFR